MTQDELQETVEAVEAPWNRRYERELREICEDESLAPVKKSRKLVKMVDDLGLQPPREDQEDRPGLMSQVMFGI